MFSRNSLDRFARARRIRALRWAAAAALTLLWPIARLHAGAPEKVTLALLPFLSNAPIFLAKERGYFTAEGIDLELKVFQAAQPVSVAVASGDADFGVTAFTGAFFNLAGKGVLKVIAAQSREEPGYDFVAYVASKKAYEAGLHAPKDLAGKRVAISTVGSSFHYDLGLLATKYGFALSQVQLKPLQSIPNMTAALVGGQVDAALLPANNAIKLRNDGVAKIVGWVHEQTPWQLGALFTSTKNVQTRRPLLARFIRAYQRGLADYATAFLARDASGKRVFGEQAAAALPILQKWVEPKPTLENAELAANYADPKGRLLVQDIYDQVAWYQAQGLVDRAVKPADFLELSFIQGHLDLPKR
jgi:NitT/TauT family transport system substrate-binding protein